MEKKQKAAVCENHRVKCDTLTSAKNYLRILRRQEQKEKKKVDVAQFLFYFQIFYGDNYFSVWKLSEI